MKAVLIFLYVFTLVILRIDGVKESKSKLSREDVGEIEQQIQILNNYTVKTIRTSHGDLYDCVNFYKQLAFNHPLSKNHTFIPQRKPTHEKARNKHFSVKSPKVQLNGRGCPDGTVPIKRVTKEDLIRVKLAHANDDKPAGTRYAGCSAQENTGYTGVAASIVAYNPEVSINQYSAAVMKLQIGRDSIEAGWRVDPKLYKDYKTHLYIHTNTRNSNCFDALCPGFVVTGKSIPLGYIIDKVSTPGGIRYGFDMSITNDKATARWILKLTGGTEIGHWPNYLFEQPDLANYVAWGGEVFGPDGTRKPPMGSSEVVTENTAKDAYFSNVKVINGPTSGGQPVDPINLKCSDETVYEARDEGNVGDGLQYLIFYGGPEETSG